jgi:tRNA(His) 5'-end guanylyltransferase
MKTYYEQVPKYRLMRRTPVAIRIDGKAFHTFTRGFQKPFDEVLGNSMVRTMEYLCKNIQGCVFGYTQSDEITLLLVDYQTLETDAWFDYEVQKMCSIAASMATMAFNRYFIEEVENYCINEYINCRGFKDVKQVYSLEELKTVDPVLYAYNTAMERGAMFDARCLNIPKEEVTNLIYWRQLDAARNSVQMAARAKFSHNQCDKKNVSQLQEMLFQVYGINWNDYPIRWKRGVAWTRATGVDYEMPMLKGENRAYVDNLIFVGE